MPVDPAFIAGLPKAELHVHHVGSASPRIVSELARRHPGTVPDDPEELRRFFEFRDFAHFIEVYLAVVDLVRTPEDVRVLTYEVAREMATEQSLRYAELTCTPYTSVRPHEDGVGMPIEAYTEALEDARVAAERDFGLVLRWIYDIPGEAGLPAADATLEEHPLPRFVEAGVTVAIASDDPPMFGTTLNREYELAADLLDLDEEGVRELARTSVRASFAPDDVRRSLLAAIDDYA